MAQVVIDQFLVSGEEKWGQTSGLTLLLPHGFEGQGPEHSSARLERFLELSADDNIQVCVPSTPAQYFHVLRRQMRRDIRKPLIVLTPKSLLRLPAARSPAAAFERGHFLEVMPDPREPAADGIELAILCSGKIAYELQAERDRLGTAGEHVAILRLEQMYPFPGESVREALERYPKVRVLRWVQEEPDNMGALRFVHLRQHRAVREGMTFQYVARSGSGSPAAGSATVHEEEQRRLLDGAFGPV
jgi:2-oxoglutarate dehydrogenase E1 component